VYHDRGWLLSATTSDGSSSRPVRVEYWPHGKVKKVSQPDGSFMQMGYDAAQRLISVTDNLGNSVSYTLDNAGNRTDEQFKDASNTLRQRVTRMYSAINLLQSVTGALQ
jgi:YD repeat-containing protein